jgi:hypothetical protein
MKRRRWIAAIVCAAGLAAAEPKTPDEWFDYGQNQYNLGNFDKAIEAFKKGFELEPSESKKAAYLFNIAQAYRQAQNCKEAQFFYKRYLAFKDADTKKPLSATDHQMIEDRIKELDECIQKQAALQAQPPQNPLKPDPDPPKDPKDPKKTVATKPDDPDDDHNVTKPADTGVPHTISLRAYGGGAKVSMADLDIPIQATANLIAGYPIAVAPKLTIEVGGNFSFTPLPSDDKSAQLLGVLANAGVTYAVAPKIGVRADVGVGVLVLTGASESVFTAGAKTSGALSMLNVRVGASADYAFTKNVVGTITPIAFSYSPAKAGLATMMGDIKTITTIDFMVGIGYRM